MVPINFMRHMCRNHGVALPKRPVFKKKQETTNGWFSRGDDDWGSYGHPEWDGWNKRYKPQSQIVPVNTVLQKNLKLIRTFNEGLGLGNLHENEYRFWVGAGSPQAVYSKCRACDMVIYSAAARTAHQRTNGCTKVLRAAYELLLRDSICVICDKHTRRSKWGVPLCDITCDRLWRFDSLKGISVIRHAMREIKRNEELASRAPIVSA